MQIVYRKGRMEQLEQIRSNLLQGTLDMLILKALSLGEMHGLGVSRRIEQITSGAFHVKPGSLFPALHRMEQAGWLLSSWGESENRRRAKYYKLSRAGRKQLKDEAEEWGRIALAIASALGAT
jgi:transcriptional regulator